MPSIGTKPAPPPKPETLTVADDDWETDPTFIVFLEIIIF